nr:hypothetical protein [Mycoplasmopsis agalactiae]
MKKKLTIALSSVIGTALLATAVAVPVALHQKIKNHLWLIIILALSKILKIWMI